MIIKKPYLLIFFLLPSLLIAQKNYFQQEVDTYIEVKLDDENHSLTAFEKIIYKNNSSQQLDSIVFHLWPNAYKNVNTEMAKHNVENGDIEIRFANSSERGYIDSLNFKCNGKKLKWSYYKNNIDIATIIYCYSKRMRKCCCCAGCICITR